MEQRDLEQVLEIVAKNVLEAEQEFWRTESVDDNDHIPAIRRVIESVIAAARELDLPEGGAKGLQARLEQYAEDQYMATWMSHVYEDEDPEEVREEGRRVFRHVWEGGRR